MTAVSNPLELLHADRARARAADDPWASLCVVATVRADGGPAARTLVLRDVADRLAIFINATSPKYAELNAASHGSSRLKAGVVCYFASLQVQYRLDCQLEEVPSELVHDSWQLRPSIPQRLDWVYTYVKPQSASVSDRAELLAMIDRAPIPDPPAAPATAIGYFLDVSAIDRLHLGEADGIHDRRAFHRTADGWHDSLLVP